MGIPLKHKLQNIGTTKSATNQRLSAETPAQMAPNDASFATGQSDALTNLKALASIHQARATRNCKASRAQQVGSYHRHIILSFNNYPRMRKNGPNHKRSLGCSAPSVAHGTAECALRPSALQRKRKKPLAPLAPVPLGSSLDPPPVDYANC